MSNEKRLVTIKEASALIDGLSQYRIRKMHPKSTSFGRALVENYLVLSQVRSI